MKKLSILSLALASSMAFAYEDTATIKKVEPQYTTVNKPVETCRMETVTETVQPQAQQQAQTDRNYSGAVIGGIAGGVLGNQVGKGNGKKAATAAGVIAGALIGDTMGNGQFGTPIQTNPGNIQYHPQEVSRQVRNCVMENVPTQELTGYRVEYVYGGRTQSYVSQTKPVGTKIKVKVDVQPISN